MGVISYPFLLAAMLVLPVSPITLDDIEREIERRRSIGAAILLPSQLRKTKDCANNSYMDTTGNKTVGYMGSIWILAFAKRVWG